MDRFLIQAWGRITPRAAVILIVPILLLTMVYTPRQASALAGSPARCSDTSWLLDDDWVSTASKHFVTYSPGSHQGVMDAWYPHHVSQASQFSFIIGRFSSSTDTHNLNIVVIDNSDSSHWDLQKDGTTGYYATPIGTSSNAYSSASISDFNWDSGTNALQSGKDKSWPTIGPAPFYLSPSSPPKATFSCIATVNNVTYDPSWDGNTFSTKLLYGTSTIQCDKLDVGCWVTKAWSGVADTFTSVGQALLSGIASLFAPDMEDVTSAFTDLQSSFSVHLGFLTYPFEFIGDIFDAFSSASSWCSTSSCVKDFGNFYGHDFSINLSQMAVTMPTLWTWFVGLVRGTTILILILAVRRKYMGVVGK